MDSVIEQKVAQFFSQFPTSEYNKGEILIQAEEPPAGIFYLQSGTIRQYAISSEGDEMTMNLFKPKAFFPMMWALNDSPNRYYFEAVDHVTVHIAPRSEVVQFIKNESDVLFDLTSRIFKGLHGLLARMEYLMTGNARAKVIFTILNTAYRFSDANKSMKNISLRMTHKDLAAISGVTRETFSREIKKLEDQNLIVLENHFISIPSLDALEEELLLG